LFQLVEKDQDMSGKTEISTAAVTFACAMGIGFVMQSGEVADLRYGTAQASAVSAAQTVSAEPAPVQPEPEPAAFISDDSHLNVSAIVLTSAKAETFAPAPAPEKPQLASLDNVFPLPEATAPQQPDCPVSLTATPGAAAMVRLSLTAPCLPSERVGIFHEGMTFAETISSDGTLDIEVPTLVEDARFTLTLPNGEALQAEASVPSVALYDRIVVQWAGGSGLQIHAREFGAEYGDEGHVWSGAPRDITAIARGEGGFLTRHGDPDASDPMMAEVYTFPGAMTKVAGAITLSIETEVTQSNCGTEVSAQSFEVSAGVGGIETRELLLSIPDCSAIGNFLVLNNPLHDLKIARN
jgi:hypothetical protein